VSYVPLGRLYTQIGQYDKARIYLNELVSTQYKSIIPISIQRDAHMMLFKADSVSGNYLTAIGHMHSYQAMNDSIFSERQAREIEKMELQYETDKKDRDIDLLISQGAVRELELNQTRFARNAFIGGAVLLIALLGLLYGRYRLKQNTNELLQSKQERINQSNQQLLGLNGELKKLLDEKEWLVKEIHHRVKNNLQVIVSLLNTQAAHLGEGEALEAIRDSQLRMQVISLLHQKLYQVDNSTIANMKKYIPELLTYIKDSHKAINHLYFELAVDAIELDISQAVPVGLILNEAITNSIKHGFKQSTKGTIRILFEEGERRHLFLTISDNGSGLPGNFEATRKFSLGMRLMETLSEQLGGSMIIEDKDGTSIKIAFVQAIDDQAKYALRGNQML
jgi:two-component sensor histidine kinase